MGRESGEPLRVKILALPESTGTPIHGSYETLTLVDAVSNGPKGLSNPFTVEIVGPEPGVQKNAFGLPLDVQRSVTEVGGADLVIMTSMLIQNEEWVVGRYPEVVQWLREMHAEGAHLYSACAGALLLAETGLLDGLEATTHWAFAPTFRKNFPAVELRIEELLVVAGKNQELVMSGAASSWQDLVLYLIARHASPSAAQSIAKFLLYQWHESFQSPYFSFAPVSEHGDAVVHSLEAWVRENYRVSSPVEEMAQRSGLSETSFKRRFRTATGFSPLQYVHRIRIEEAKRLLEQSEMPVDEVGWQVGYADPAFFRRLFRRMTRLTPSAYRKKFMIPEFARS